MRLNRQRVDPRQPVNSRRNHRVAQHWPDHRHQPQELDNGAKEIAKQPENAKQLDAKPNERVLHENQHNAQPKAEQPPDLAGPGEKRHRPLGPNDQNDAYDEQDVPEREEAQVKEGHDPEEEEENAAGGEPDAKLWRLVVRLVVFLARLTYSVVLKATSWCRGLDA